MYTIVAIMGKSSSGKTTFQKVVSELFDVNEIVLTTTRPAREGEVEGKDCNFVTIEEFTERVLNGEMLEAADFNDWFYGTEISALKENKVNVGVFSPDGVEALAQDGRIDLRVVYLNVEDKLRILRSLNREKNPDVGEICRRYFSDEKDFSNDRMDELADMNIDALSLFLDGSESLYQLVPRYTSFIFGLE